MHAVAMEGKKDLLYFEKAGNLYLFYMTYLRMELYFAVVQLSAALHLFSITLLPLICVVILSVSPFSFRLSSSLHVFLSYLILCLT